MPVRMTDLLDGWEDGSVELPPPAGMSPEWIKERTMEKIRQTKRPRRTEPARPQAKPMSRSISSSRAEGSPRRRRRNSSRSSNHTTSLLRFRARSH